MELTITDMQAGYVEVCQRVLRDGDRVAPRGQSTRELLNVTITHRRPENSLVQHVNRHAKTSFAALEALQLIGGVSRVDLMLKVAPATQQFLSHSLIKSKYFHGAYGPRVKPGLVTAVQRLRDDHDTRQAVVAVWDNHKDAVIVEPDLPCTLSLHLMIRRWALDLHVTMRSNDVWWGLAYDVFQFTNLQRAVARTLNLPVGVYYHHVNSLHLYERDVEKVEALTAPTQPADVVTSLGLVNGSWLDTMEEARHLLDGEPLSGTGWWRHQVEEWA